MTAAGPKQTIFAGLADIAQALAHPHRIELVERLAQGQHSVEALANACGLSVANASRHLQILRRARLVETERQGKHVLYRLAGEREVVALMSALGSIGERNHTEVRQVMLDYFASRDAMTPMSRAELLARLQVGEVALLDVRPEHEYLQGHIPGALNVPIGELTARLASLPAEQEIVAYCRGPYCVMSFDAVALLRARGYKVRRLEEGFPEWKAAGLRIAEGRT